MSASGTADSSWPCQPARSYFLLVLLIIYKWCLTNSGGQSKKKKKRPPNRKPKTNQKKKQKPLLLATSYKSLLTSFYFSSLIFNLLTNPGFASCKINSLYIYLSLPLYHHPCPNHQHLLRVNCNTL